MELWRDGEAPRGVSPKALEILSGHDWPGNVAELASAVEKAAIQCEGDEIGPEHLPALGA